MLIASNVEANNFRCKVAITSRMVSQYPSCMNSPVLGGSTVVVGRDPCRPEKEEDLMPLLMAAEQKLLSRLRRSILLVWADGK